MKYRKLRIAWSVVWGIVAVLLCVLWVRTYRWADGFTTAVFSPTLLGVGSVEGEVITGIGDVPNWYAGRYQAVSTRVGGRSVLRLESAPNYRGAYGFGFASVSSITAVCFPFWFPTLVSSAAAALPWFASYRRFSLRTLLIATTLVAVVLGLIVFVSSK